MDYNTLCQRFGEILNGESQMKNGVCSVEIARNLDVTIQGRSSRGELHAELMFESIDQYGQALNRGETVVLPEEVPRFTERLVGQGVMISALHNHWLFTEPNILYIHFQSIENPLSFAEKTAYAFKVFEQS